MADNIPRELDSSDLEIIHSMLEDMLGPCLAPQDDMYCPQGATFLDQIENQPPLHNVSVHSFLQEKQTNPVPKPCPPQSSTSKQQHCGAVQKEPYVKRPPNAFMVFMRENRNKVSQTLKPKHSVEANTILGQMWRNMSSEEQEVYYEKAAEERRLHSVKHPEWSSKDNYGKKVKRQRRKGIII
ncbi:protein pop-1-like isoform 1-T1 [Synchiropus picturatus]